MTQPRLVNRYNRSS